MLKGVMFVLWPLDRLLAILAFVAVLAYRRWISPRKGFKCAVGALTEEPSCSEVGLEAFRRRTLSAALPVIWAQFAKCRKSYGEYKSDLLMHANDNLSRYSAFASTGVVLDCCGGGQPPPPPPI